MESKEKVASSEKPSSKNIHTKINEEGIKMVQYKKIN